MDCNGCNESKPIPICTGFLRVGSVDVVEDVYVFIKNNATGYIAKQSVTPEYGGVVRIDMQEPYPDFYSPNFYYRIWVSSSADGNDILTFNVESVEVDCITAKFQAIHQEDGIYSLDDAEIKL